MDDRTKKHLETVLRDAVSSGGITMARAATELLYLLPDDFASEYTRLFHTALSGADGGSGSRAEAGKKKGELGKASGLVPKMGKGSEGGMGRLRAGDSTRAIGRAAKSTSTYRGAWTIGSEEALALKTKVDKRLRAIARDIAEELREIVGEEGRVGAEGVRRGKGAAKNGRGELRNMCSLCRKFLQDGWGYCPHCGGISTEHVRLVEAARRAQSEGDRTQGE